MNSVGERMLNELFSVVTDRCRHEFKNFRWCTVSYRISECALDPIKFSYQWKFLESVMSPKAAGSFAEGNFPRN